MKQAAKLAGLINSFNQCHYYNHICAKRQACGNYPTHVTRTRARGRGSESESVCKRDRWRERERKRESGEESKQVILSRHVGICVRRAHENDGLNRRVA
jgi:hypothetical protein